MSKGLIETKIVTVDSEPTSLNVTIYISDRASGSQPRIIINMQNEEGQMVHSTDKRLSDYSNLSANQKQMLLNLCVALRDETFILENFKDVVSFDAVPVFGLDDAKIP